MSAENATSGAISVTGEGQVRAQPDIASLNLGVLTVSKSAKEAMAKNAELMTRVIQAIKQAGAQPEDIRTLGFSISPITDSLESSPSFGQIKEYRVENVVTVRVSIELAGTVLDAGVGAGANVSGHLSFGLRDETAVRKQALHAAVQAAHRDAQTVANAAGITLMEPNSLEVVYVSPTVILRGLMRANRLPMTPIEPGLLVISASVRVVYNYQEDIVA